jgi:hypothetical protein
MKLILITLLFFIIFNIGVSEDLSMILSIDRDTVYVADPLFSISLTIKNISTKPQKVINTIRRNIAKEKGDGLKEIIISPIGETLSLTLETWEDYFDMQPEYLVSLSPGKSLVTELYDGGSLYYCYGIGRLINSAGKQYKLPVAGFPAGTYRIKVIWRNVASNELMLTFIQPKGNMAKAYDLYLEALYQLLEEPAQEEKGLSQEEYFRNRIQRSIAVIAQLEKNYNFEPYASLAYHQLLLNTPGWLNEFKDLLNIISPLQIYTKIMENYPNSRTAEWHLRRPYIGKKGVFQSKEEYHSFLRTMVERFPNTLAGRTAKQELEKQ